MFQGISTAEADIENDVVDNALLTESPDVRSVQRHKWTAVGIAVCGVAACVIRMAFISARSEHSVPLDSMMQASGLNKAKQYDWKDSDLAMFGSDMEKQVKKEAAEAEKAWKDAGKEVGLQIWRIVKFKVVEVPKEEYGRFYSGDSYIVLKTYVKDGDPTLLYNVHFWIGKYSTQDEYGTAAYKTVELDTKLDDLPVQHREVQGSESELFKGYFDKIVIMKGGVGSGFEKVLPEQKGVRLFEVKDMGRGKIAVTMISAQKNLKSDSVYIVEDGDAHQIFQWNGAEASKDAKFKASQQVQTMRNAQDRPPRCIIVDESKAGPGHPAVKALKSKSKVDVVPDIPTTMWKLVDDGEGGLQQIKDFSSSSLDSKHVLFIDTKDHIFAWIGKEAAFDDRRNAMPWAHRIAEESSNPLRPVSVLAEGSETEEFRAAIAPST